ICRVLNVRNGRFEGAFDVAVDFQIADQITIYHGLPSCPVSPAQFGGSAGEYRLKRPLDLVG
ncbi:MAG: hypothetical protein JJ992_11415, partial [Planctomycetes bacterium]|nr:hypothetical protein [Planctomycetota bacterium]